MAHASGPAETNFIPADFVHANTGVHYRIYAEDNRVWLSFERPGDKLVRGRRELLYYIGSGRRGLKYLFAQSGFLFESPIDWYAGPRSWDMTPNYQSAREIPLNLPALTSCLRCHVSGMRPPSPGTQNHYPLPAFASPGISCERCHGSGANHIKGGAIVNPAKLSADRRDAICMQCHLEGRVGIERRGRHAYDFQPGEQLTDYIRHYVLTGITATSLSAVSEFEALAESMCKKKSGAMSCFSCHDPHYSPSPTERISYFRSKCLSCHRAGFGLKHHPENLDCTQCHMPAILSVDVAHTQVVDHRISRRPANLLHKQQGPTRISVYRLTPFPDSEEARRDVRDMGLAWESLMESGLEGADFEAERMLSLAETQSPDDAVVLAALGYTKQRRGSVELAAKLYQRAFALDPTLTDAPINLGVVEARSGHITTAIRLWQDVFVRAPGMSGLGMNIVRALCSVQRFDEARSTVLRVLEFNPDMTDAKNALKYLNRTPASCGL